MRKTPFSSYELGTVLGSSSNAYLARGRNLHQHFHGDMAKALGENTYLQAYASMHACCFTKLRYQPVHQKLEKASQLTPQPGQGPLPNQTRYTCSL